MNSQLAARDSRRDPGPDFGPRELRDLLDHYSSVLPVVEPIGEFIHYNTLQAFLGVPFEEALFKARNIYGARPYMPMAFYRSKFAGGVISRDVLKAIAISAIRDPSSIDLALVILEHSPRLYDPSEVASAVRDLSPPDREIWERVATMFPLEWFSDGLDKNDKSRSLMQSRRIKEASERWNDDLRRPLRDLWTPALGERIQWLANPVLYRLLASFLDQGVATWQMPWTSGTFYQAAKRLMFDGMIPDPGLVDLASLDTLGAIEALLRELVGDQALWPVYLRETVMASPGWSSLVAQISRKGERLQQRRKIDLADLVACSLTVEYALLRGVYNVHDRIGSLLCGPDSSNPEVPFASGLKIDPANARLLLLHDVFDLARSTPVERWPAVMRLCLGLADVDLERIWHDAFESTYYHSVLGIVVPRARALASGEFQVEPSLVPSAQLIFCLDDRECSMRRYVEQLDPRSRTYGMPGFFGIDMMFLGVDKDHPEKYCPVPMSPRHIVLEHRGQGLSKKRSGKNRRRRSRPLVIAAPLRMLQLWLNPAKVAKSMRNGLSGHPTSIEFKATPQVPRSFAGYQVGYTAPEMADRIEAALRSMGMTRNFAPVVLIVAHGSSAVNNPYYAAYDCAACSGRQGIPNVRVFAGMANDEEVRSILRARGINIPEETFFIPAFHDTATDDFRYYDISAIETAGTKNTAAHEAFWSIRKNLQTAAGLNAMERCARFEKAPRKLTPRKALREVRLRASALFEPRAELGHATNAACVIGRRELTTGLSLNRRSFLVSYDPVQDPDGKWLAGILAAAIPVSGGINLDYFFSRIDNKVYGCESKLSLNVVGMVGVSHGVDDDIQTGLPSQMVELHDPVRLLFMIDQDPGVVRRVIDGSPLIKNWVDNKWVRVSCIDPVTGNVSFLCAPDSAHPSGIRPWQAGEVLP